MLVFCMKRILVFMLSLCIVISNTFCAYSVNKSTYKFFNNGEIYNFSDNNTDYIVSIKSNSALINKIGVGYSKINADKKIIKCNYAGGYFHLFLESNKNSTEVIRFNYNKGKYQTISINDSIKTGCYLCSVDNNCNYYFVNYYDRTLLYKYNSQGNLIKTIKFDGAIHQIDTTSGKYQFVLTAYGLCYISDDKIYSTDNDYNIFPMTMINDKYYSAKGYIRTLSNNYLLGDYIEHKTALLSNGVAYCNDDIITYSPFDKSDTTSYYKFNFDIDYLFGCKDRVIATKGNNIYTVKISDFKVKTTSKVDNSNNTQNNTINNNTYNISSDVYNIGEEYITGVSSNTTLSTFKKNINYDGLDITFLKNNNIVTSGNIGTGMKVKFTANNSAIEKIIIVKGDINGSGTVNSNDTELFMKFLLNTQEFTDVQKIASNINNDSILDNRDLVLMSKMNK